MPTIWTRCAGSDHIRRASWNSIRVVTDESREATVALTDDEHEHDELEAMLEEVKPRPRPAADDLRTELRAPFRYPRADGRTRFSSPAYGSHFYGAEQRRTAFAERSFAMFLFYEHQGPGGVGPCEVLQLSFTTRITTDAAIDLTLPPFSAFQDQICDPASYTHAHALAEEMQAAGIEAVRYLSCRDPDHGACHVAFAPAALSEQVVEDIQTWRMSATPTWVRWRQVTSERGPVYLFHRSDQLQADGSLPIPTP